MKKIALMLCFVSLVGSAFSQSKMEEALSQEGITPEEVVKVTTYYYLDPQPERLIQIVKVFLNQDEIANSPNHFTPFAHFVATIAQNNPEFITKLKSISQELSLSGQAALGKIVYGAENFQSPTIAETAADLDCLWGEFLATGDQEPVKKIISVLGKPETGMNILLVGAANWSLGSNAQQHEKVYEIIQEESVSATGKIKEKLDLILKGGSGLQNNP